MFWDNFTFTHFVYANLMFSCYHNMITWTYRKALRKHGIEVHFAKTWSSSSLSWGETSYPLFSSFLLYTSMRRLWLAQRKKIHTQNNVQYLVKLVLKFVNARSFLMTVILWTENVWKISFEIFCNVVLLHIYQNDEHSISLFSPS